MVRCIHNLSDSLLTACVGCVCLSYDVREWCGAANSCSERVPEVHLGQWDSCSPRHAGTGQWEGAISIGSLRDSCESPCEVVTHPWDVPNPCEGWNTALSSREGCVNEGFAVELRLRERLVCLIGLFRGT